MASRAEVAINVDGLGSEAGLQVEILDQAFRPLAGFSGTDAAILRESGLRRVVTWPDGSTDPPTCSPWRVKVNFVGVHATDVRFYCLYVRDASKPRRI
jgi:hypothetical protein